MLARTLRLLGTLTSVILSTLFALLISPPALATPREKVLHSFLNCDNDACGPLAALVFDSAGNLYGAAGGGGEYTGAGTVYALTHGQTGWSEKVVFTFDVSGGDGPAAPLIVDPSGRLYGTATGGGAYDQGVVFQLTSGPDGWTETVLYSFCPGGGYCSDGQNPWAGVVRDKAGNLYGLTQQGGYNGVGGVAFELLPSSSGWTEHVIHAFSRKPDDVGVASFAPVFDKAEQHLYGTGEYGGSSGYGGVFELSRTAGGGWKERVLYSFQVEKDGGNPYGGLAMDAAGNLYGTTNGGGPTGNGAIFKLSPKAHGRWQETILYTFPHIENGGYPQGTLAIDKAGALYGIAGGGNNCSGVACGVIYKFAPHGHGKWNYTVLHKFNGSDGMWPQGGVILDKQQKHLYGTTEYGGAYGYGVVFEITLK